VRETDGRGLEPVYLDPNRNTYVWMVVEQTKTSLFCLTIEFSSSGNEDLLWSLHWYLSFWLPMEIFWTPIPRVYNLFLLMYFRTMVYVGMLTI